VPRGAVLYLGDALPTTGALDATALRATLANLDDPPRFFGFAIGDGANIDLLRALFGEQATAVRDRENAARAVMHLLADAARPMLRGLRVELGESIERIYPAGPITIAEGQHLRLVGRSVDSLPEVAIVRGMRDGEAFEQSIPLRVSAIEDEGDVRKRWATARLRELLDEDAGREAMVELGLRFGLVTPWTSLMIGAAPNQPVPLISNFDYDPVSVAWGLGGGGASIEVLNGDELGWRRRSRSIDTSAQSVSPEATWAPRVDPSPAPPERSSLASSEEAGLGRAAVDRAMRSGERGPRQCYERRSLLRPDLAGNVSVRVVVEGDGAVREATISNSTLRDADTEQCITTEVRGLRFPAHGGTEITVTHTFTFMVPERELGARRQCGDASREALETRRTLWSERLSLASPGVAGMLSVWREARAQCELSTWRARRTLLDLILARLPYLRARIELYHALGSDASIGNYVRRAILRAVRTPEDAMIVRAGLGLDVPVDWSLFSRLWWQNESAEARLALVRRWLAVAPSEMDLRLRLLMLLEETHADIEARRVARELRADPLADPRVRTAVGEFWLRQGDEAEAIRVWSEIVEHAPFDPWARRRLGDLYRAHGRSHEGYREYETLARLRPGDGEVLLLLARAAADAGRIDEALRLEQRLGETAEPQVDEGMASVARLWSTVRLARLELDATDDSTRAALRRRWRETGVLRDPPDLIAILTWPHPDDAPRLFARLPDAENAGAWTEATLGTASHGIVAMRVQEGEEGDYFFEIRRDERAQPIHHREDESDAELIILVHPGTAEQRIVRQPGVGEVTVRL
jgi:tetratricopeptide (TPR) repeat protein